MSKLGTSKNPAIIKLGNNSKQELILSLLDKKGIIYIAGLENEENLDDLKKLLSKEEFYSIADPDSISNSIGSFISRMVSSGTPGRNAPCPCGSRKQYKRCCGK